MEVSKRVSGNVTILDIPAEIDLYNTIEIEDIVKNLIREKRILIVLNLANAPYIDSTGLGMLLGFGRTLRGVNGRLALINMGDNLRKIFQMTKLSEKFEIFETEALALAALG